MKLVLAFEGIDGSGKSSLVIFAKKFCEQHGHRFTQVGRRETFGTPLVAQFTRMLHEEAANLTPPAEAALRVAREYQRAELAAAAPPGLVVFDRFVLSTLGFAHLHGLNVAAFRQLLKEAVTRANLFATVFVTCPFDVARGRVKERSQNLVLRRGKDERLLRRLGEQTEDEFYRGEITGQPWRIENEKALADAEQQLADYLLPYLKGTA